MIKEIQTFLSIYEHGTFASAGEKLNLTQSAISAQIKNLEKQLGFALFNRNRRGAVLSEAGEQVLPIARQIITLFDEMSKYGEGNHFDTLKIGIQASLQAQIIPNLLIHLPKKTQVKFQDNIKLLDSIRQNIQHIAIIVQPDTVLPNDFVITPLLHDECVLLAPPHSSGDYTTLLTTYPILAYDSVAFGNQSLTEFFKQHHVGLPLLSSSDVSTLVDLVAQNMGVTVLPKSCLKNSNLNNLTVVPVPLAREIIVVSFASYVSKNQAIAVIWQHNTQHHQSVRSSPTTWQHTHQVKEAFGLPKFILAKHYKN